MIRTKTREEWKAEHDASMKRPSAGIAKVGPNRWFWVWWPSHREQFDGEDPHRYGYADTYESAVESCGGIDTFMWDRGFGERRFTPGAYLATEWRSIFAARRRKPNTKDVEAKATEYVYHGRRCKHRITKKTPKKIFCVADCASPFTPERIHTTGGVFRVKQITFDRARLERTHQYSDSADYYGYFSLTPPDERVSDDDVPECLAALGLPASATVAQVKSRFRKLSKQHHPDHGGDPDAFRELLKNYEQALAMVAA
jgi:hypothetical protein